MDGGHPAPVQRYQQEREYMSLFQWQTTFTVENACLTLWHTGPGTLVGVGALYWCVIFKEKSR